MIRARVIGCGACLPDNVVSNDELAKRVDTSDAWIRERTGITQRYIAPEGQNTSDLALGAGRAALTDAGIDAGEVDLVIVATTTPDRTFPSVGTMVQSRLGMSRGAAFDVQAVCSGFIYGLSLADSLIRTGQARTILLIGAETMSRVLDWNDRTTCVLFGDGAGAVILKADAKPGIMASALHADGSYAGILSVPGNVCGGKVIGDPFLRMDGPAVFKFAVRVLDEVARETVGKCGLQIADIDWLIPHQANLRILESTAKRLGLPPEKVIVTVDIHGNTSAASVPLALDAAIRDGRIRSGHKVMLQAVGGGFTWGAALVQL